MTVAARLRLVRSSVGLRRAVFHKRNSSSKAPLDVQAKPVSAMAHEEWLAHENASSIPAADAANDRAGVRTMSAHIHLVTVEAPAQLDADKLEFEAPLQRWTLRPTDSIAGRAARIACQIWLITALRTGSSGN